MKGVEKVVGRGKITWQEKKKIGNAYACEFY